MYYFTELTLALNQPDSSVAPTDSRRRPDQRLMENCKWDEANQEKQKLEELQRTRRRKREFEASEAEKEGKVYEGYKPVWFENVVDELSDSSSKKKTFDLQDDAYLSGATSYASPSPHIAR